MFANCFVDKFTPRHQFRDAPEGYQRRYQMRIRARPLRQYDEHNARFNLPDKRPVCDTKNTLSRGAFTIKKAKKRSISV